MDVETRPNFVTRTIQFYQIQWIMKDPEEEDEVRIVTKNQDFFESTLSNLLNKIHSRGEDYSVILEETKLSGLPVTGFFGKISKVRTSALPQKYIISQNKSESLGLGDDEGLYEPSHFAVFEGQIIINEFNFYGSRISTLRSMLNDFLKENPVDNISEIQIKPILRTDPIKTLNNFTEIRGIDIAVATDYARKLKDEGGSFRSMFASEEFVEQMYLAVSFELGRLRPDNPLSKFERVRAVVKKLLERDDFNEGVKSLHITGRQMGEEEIIPVNLAQQIFKTKKKVAKLNNETNAVDSDEMYKEIASSYLNHKEEINSFIQERD